MQDSGLAVNINKTELVYFSNKPTKGNVKLGNLTIESKTSMKILGVVFDSKLSWIPHIDSCIQKTKQAVSGLRHISKYIPQDKMMSLATSFAYSRLYYGAEVWLIPSLIKTQWTRLMSTSTNIIKTSLRLYDWKVPYKDLHEIGGRGTPNAMCKYFTAAALYDTLATSSPPELANLASNSLRLHHRSDRLYTTKRFLSRIGSNSLASRIDNVIREIPASWFHLERNPFKSRIKSKFLK